MRELPHLVYLQAFEAAARHLIFTRATAELNCTQAAIGQRVRGLKQYSGRPLFQRLPSGIELSSAGKAYLPGITQALDMAASAKSWHSAMISDGRSLPESSTSASIRFR